MVSDVLLLSYLAKIGLSLTGEAMQASAYLYSEARLNTVGAQSIAHFVQNYFISLNSIFGHRCTRELWFLLFERSSIGEEFKVLNKQYILNILLSKTV